MYCMQERIILAPGASPAELLRTLAKFGVNTLGLRIVSPAELARTALMKSGICVSDEFLPSLEEPSLIFSFLNEIPYFESASYADAQEYYQNGFLRFDGKWEKNKGYGPNIPKEGSFYSPDGELVFTGSVSCRKSGLGYPLVVKPNEYGAVVQTNCPHYDQLLYDSD